MQGEKETGILIAATGVGSVISLVLLACMPDFACAGRVLIVTSALYGVSIALFAGASVFLLSAGLLLVAGFMRSTYRAINHTMLLKETEAEYRGRVNSIYLLDRGLVPPGTVLLGLMAALLGPQTAVAIMGSVCTLGIFAAVALAPRIWRI